MPRVAAIVAIFSTLLVGCICGLCCVHVSAQVPEVQEEARKFDEFGRVGHCDVTARLDNLAIQLQNTPKAEAHIIAYAPPGQGEQLLKIIKDYLINTRGLRAKQIKTTYGGRNSDLNEAKIELWIVPQNAAPPETQTHETKVETFTGRLLHSPAGDDYGVDIPLDMGPGIGGTTDASFVDILNQQKNSIGYVVVYSGEDLTPGAWRIIAQNKVDYLKELQLGSDRVKVIFGGHRKETALELWVLPKNAPPPVREAGPEQPLARTVKVGDFSEFTLGKQNQTNLFTRLTGILRAQKNLRAFLVVSLEVPTPVALDEVPAIEEPPVASVEAAEPIEEEPLVDFTKLVEKWRVELANTHKIGADRFIVLFTTGGVYEPSHLSLWIVPKGQPLPDPKEEEEEEPEEEPSPSPTPATPKPEDFARYNSGEELCTSNSAFSQSCWFSVR